MRKSILLACCVICGIQSFSQVSVNNDGSAPHNSAILDLKSNTRGFLPPRMTWAQIQAISNPAEGLTVYDTGIKSLRMFNGKEWVVLGVKEYELTDPPGNFSTMAVTSGTGTAGGYEVLVWSDKTVYVAGTYTGNLSIGGTTINSPVGSYDIFIAAFDSISSLLWVKTINGGTGKSINDMKFDVVGNLLLTGAFTGTVDLDPGPGIDNHSASGAANFDIFFAKYDHSGNLLWGKHVGSTNHDVGQAIISDGAGGVFVSGYFFGTVDFDPGAGTVNHVSAGTMRNDIFLARYDVNGNWVWSRSMGNTDIENANELELLSGNILLGGSFNGTVDFDPSAGTTNLVSAGSYDIYFAKYDMNGGFLSAKRIGGTLEEQLGDIIADPSGNYWATGFFSGTVDMDPDAGVFNLVSASGDYTFIAKYQSAGTFVLAKAFGSTSTAEGAGRLGLDVSGNVYICNGYWGVSGQMDFDPGSATVGLVSNNYDWYIAKYSSSGNFLWVADMGGNDYDYATAIATSPDGKFIVTTGFLSSPVFRGFNGERIINSTQFYLGRYEE